MKGRPYSIGKALSRQLMLVVMLTLSAMCGGIYWATRVYMEAAQERLLDLKVNKLNEAAQAYRPLGQGSFLALLQANAERRPDTRLELRHADGTVFYQDPPRAPFLLSAHSRERRFTLGPIEVDSPPLHGWFAIDTAHDSDVLATVATILLAACVCGTLAVGASTLWTVRRSLRPLHRLAARTRDIAPDDMGARLTLQPPVRELQPWVDQFNGLMDRIEQAYRQLESFNADVAHELRTPLSALIGQTEVAIGRERDTGDLRCTLQSNLEELHRLASLVQDMLFLSRADRGVMARRGSPVQLATIVRQVAEFHEASVEDRGLMVDVRGDAHARVDENLFKQAVSNLLDNATRFATTGTTIRIGLDMREGGQVAITVENAGPPIAPENLARIFERFFRADAARAQGADHHGLGLAIVAAIARMHAGSAWAESMQGVTRVGFRIAAA
jgi:two-component system heavy metal sensor histidine kinase CusS